MAVTIVAGSVVGSSSSVVITKPTGVAAGDLLLALMESANGTGLPTVPTGWTLLDSITNAASGAILGYLIAGASEPGSYTWAQSSGSSFNVWSCIALRAGAGGTLGIDAHSNASGSSATTLTPTALTATLAGDALILMLSDANDVAVTTWPSGVTERTDASNAAGNGVDTGTKLSLGTGSTGSLATTIPGGAGDENYFAVLVKETPAATGPNMGTIGGARGQWPVAPLRTTQRVPLTRLEHNVAPASAGSPTGGGLAASDLTYDNAAQFYGDGTQTSTIKPPPGAWPVAPLRSTQRPAFAWNSHNTTGVAANDLLSTPPGQTAQVFGIPDALGTQPLDPTPTGVVVNAALVESAAQVVSPSDSLVANAALVESAAQVVAPSDPLIANAALVASAAQVVSPSDPLVANAVLDAITSGDQVVVPSAPLQANAALVVTGSSIAGPVAVVAPPAPHGQWPMAPLRSTTRVTLTRLEHNAAVGIAASDLTLQGHAEQFYGDGTQVLPMKPAFGSWAGLGGLRTTQRMAFVWQPHDTPGAANDLLAVPLGQTYQFFGIPDLAGVIPAQGTTLQANAALVETAAQLVAPTTPVIANAVLSASAAQVVEPVAPVVANAALVETSAQVLGSVPVQANAALVETAAQVLAPGVLQANAALALATAQLLALAVLQANALLVATGSSISAGAQPVPVSGSLLAATTPGGLLTSATTPGGSESASSVSPASGSLIIQPI